MKRAWLFGAVLLAAGTARAVPDIVATPVTVSTSNFMQTGIALDDRNTIHMTYFDPGTGALKYSRFTNGPGGGWAAGPDVAQGVAPQSALALNGNTPHVVYYSTANARLEHARLGNAAWLPDTIQSFTASTNAFVSLAIGTDGNPRAAYYNNEAAAFSYASFEGAWSTFTVLTSTFAGPVDLALTSTDSARIAMMTGFTDVGVSSRSIAYARQNASTFTVTHLLLGSSTVPVGGLSLALDSAAEAHLAVYDGAFDALAYANLTSTGGLVGTGTLLDVTPTAGLFNDIVARTNDLPTIIYFSSGVGVRRADFDGVVWSSSTLEAGGLVGVGLSAGRNRFDHVLVGYYNGDGAGTVNFESDAARNLSMSGTVRDSFGAGIAGVTLGVTGNIGATSVSGDAAGVYGVTSLFEGGYTVTPSKDGYAFRPTSLTRTLTASLGSQDFVGGPVDFGLVGNVFDPTAGEQVTVNYSVLTGHTLIRVYTRRGEPVRTLVDRDEVAGTYSEVWDGREEGGDPVASGVYLIRIEADPIKDVKKTVVVK